MRELLVVSLVTLALEGCGRPPPAHCSSPDYRLAYSGQFQDTSAERCHAAQRCGSLTYVDCGAAADGPAYYVDEGAQCVLEVCGGACMAGPSANCRACPPPEWTCARP